MRKELNHTVAKVSAIAVLILISLLVFGADFRHLTTFVTAQENAVTQKEQILPGAIIRVTSTTQSPGGANDCTLGEAIIAANTNNQVDSCTAGSSNGPDTILLPAGTYTLTVAVDGTFGPNGLPAINSLITIEGEGAASTIIERSSSAGTTDFRLFAVNDGAGLTLNEVTVRNGKLSSSQYGAALVAGGSDHLLTINNCVFSNNVNTNSFGGAIFTYAYAVINNSTFDGNQTTGGHGGAAIYSGNNITVTGSTFTNNSATGSGGVISAGNVITTITGSTFTNNTANTGGAIDGNENSTVYISNSLLSGNVAAQDGGAIFSGYVTITNSTLSNNTAGAAGGSINAARPVTITGSTISGNNAQTSGGGIYVPALTLRNSTVSGNHANDFGGGINGAGTTGNLNFDINNSTITNNTAGQRGGGLAFGVNPSNIKNTIIAGNNSNFIAPDCYGEFAPIASQGYNLLGNNADCNWTAATGDQIGTSSAPINAQLAPLANNGGPQLPGNAGATKTHALLLNSPAIDTANPATPDGTGNSCLPTDQRGGIRPGDGDDNGTFRCDIGAFEIVEQVATRLSFTVQSSNAIAGASISPAVQVAVLDQFGFVKTDATDAITISIGNNPGGSTLSGTVTRNAVNGVATFDDLSLNKVGAGYTLQAASLGLTGSTSGAFNIAPAAPASLAFNVQPSNTDLNAVITPAVKVAVQDQFGNTVTSATTEITLTIDSNPGSRVLRGTTMRNAVSGIATFNDLYIDRLGDGYTLLADAAGLTQAVSNPFNITRPIFVVTKTADTNDGVCNADCSLREAITAANALDGADTIHFNISGAAPFIINLNSNPLPSITGPIVIDGATQPGFNGAPVVGIRGNSDIPGLNLSGNSTVRGLNFGMLGKAIYLGSDNNTVEGNFIGTDFAGNNAVRNLIGVYVNGSNNIIGGTTPASRNLISGNDSGIWITKDHNQVVGNFIGTNAAGTASLSNQSGVRTGIVMHSHQNIIGGTSPGERNVISGNSRGIAIGEPGETSSFNVIQGNYIGRNANNTANIGNNISGITIDSSHSNTIGGTSPGEGNLISGSPFGIKISGFFSTRNLIRNNSIFANYYKGIHLVEAYGTAVPLPNDPGDADTGPNLWQNYPVLDAAELTGGNLAVQGSLNSTANSTFTLEFFSNTSCSSEYRHGEGETPLGTMSVLTDGSGIAGFTANFPPVAANLFITATVTDANGNTSEFSECRQVVEHPFSISGRITDSNNLPLANTKVNLTGNRTLSTVTDGDGNYSFANLPDGVYTVTPFSTLYDFAPPSRTYTNPVGDQTNQNFVGARSRYRVTGVVRTECNGALQALGQINLTVSGSTNQSGQTDASGRAVFDLPISGNYTLTPGFGNYTFTPASVNLPNPLTADQTVEFTAQAPVPLCTKFVTSESGGTQSMNADGSAFTELAGGVEPDLSRDGSRLTFVSGQIYVANFDGTSYAQLTGGDSTKHYPRISPDKTKIVYESHPAGSSGGGRLYLINLADNSVTPINTQIQQATDQDLEPSWSPDGTKIVFRRLHKPSGVFADNIFSINVDGTNLTQLTNSTSIETNGRYSFPDFSPDGTKITFARNTNTNYVSNTNSIMVMNADGSNLTAVHTPSATLTLSHPRWSPDGNKIAFVEGYIDGGSYRRIVVINPDGSGRIKIRDGLFDGLSWSVQYQAATANGTNVPVQSGGVALNFAGITGGGQTTVSPIYYNSAGIVSGGFVLGGMAYEITTTATYTAPISVCFTVPESIASNQTQFNALSLMHSENGMLIDRTTNRDFATRQICGSVNSLSPFALAEQIDNTKPKVSGLVLDSGGNPMSGVKMFLTGAETKQTETDINGTFKFVNLTQGANYNVQPKELGYIFNAYSKDFVNLSGEETIIFAGAANSFSISGRVINTNCTGMSGVFVQLNGSLSDDTLTDANGDYTFTGLPADGSYTIKAFNGAGSFTPTEVVVNPLLDNVTGVDFTQLAPTAASVSIGGRVVTAGGLGIRNARVCLTETDGVTRCAVTGTFGFYRFDEIEVGQTVVISVFSKRFPFSSPTRIFTVMENYDELNFISDD